MRKIAAAILFALVVLTGLLTEPAKAQDGAATFQFRNNAAYTVFLKMYSNRNRVWPGATSHWTLDDSSLQSFRLSCSVGEKICFGAAYLQNGTGKYWGTGFLGQEGCQGCCLTCGSPGANVTHGWNLED